VTIDVLQRAPSAGTDQTHPTAATLARCIAEVEGSAPKFEMCPGVLETRWYAQLGIPAFGYGAGRLDVSHGPEEFIDEAAIGRCAAVYVIFAGKMLP
jgi:succinyl-diaminopimelate desuccinylase